MKVMRNMLLDTEKMTVVCEEVCRILKINFDIHKHLVKNFG